MKFCFQNQEKKQFFLEKTFEESASVAEHIQRCPLIFAWSLKSRLLERYLSLVEREERGGGE